MLLYDRKVLQLLYTTTRLLHTYTYSNPFIFKSDTLVNKLSDWVTFFD